MIFQYDVVKPLLCLKTEQWHAARITFTNQYAHLCVWMAIVWLDHQQASVSWTVSGPGELRNAKKVIIYIHQVSKNGDFVIFILLRLVVCRNLRREFINGQRSCTEDNFVGSACAYSCNQGFFLDGAAFITCLEDAKWSSEEPICRKSTKLPIFLQFAVNF